MKSGRKGNRFLSRRSIEENGVPARASSFPRAKKKTPAKPSSKGIRGRCSQVVGRRGLEPRTNCLKGNCSTIELASRPKLFAETKSEGENVFFPRERQAFFSPRKRKFFAGVPAGTKTLPRRIPAGAFFFSPKRKTTRRKSESAAAPSARAGTSSAGKPSRRRRSALRSARRCSHRRARADPSSLPRRGRESNNNSA